MWIVTTEDVRNETAEVLFSSFSDPSAAISLGSYSTGTAFDEDTAGTLREATWSVGAVTWKYENGKETTMRNKNKKTRLVQADMYAAHEFQMFMQDEGRLALLCKFERWTEAIEELAELHAPKLGKKAAVLLACLRATATAAGLFDKETL